MSDHQTTFRQPPHPNRMVTPVKPSIDDQFTWWYDELMAKDANEHPDHPVSHYDIAALAWHEAWKRATAERGKPCP